MLDTYAPISDLLEMACSLLPADLSYIKDKTCSTREYYKEFLVEYEFELAMEQLEGIGETIDAPSLFWTYLSDAASLL